jgi:hypothetical protein
MKVKMTEPSLWDKLTAPFKSAATIVAEKGKEFVGSPAAASDGKMQEALALPSEGAGRTMTGGKRYRKTRRHRGGKKHRKTGKRKH